MCPNDAEMHPVGSEISVPAVSPDRHELLDHESPTPPGIVKYLAHYTRAHAFTEFSHEVFSPRLLAATRRFARTRSTSGDPLCTQHY